MGAKNMSEKDFNAIFSKRLRYYLEKNNITQVELAKRLHVGTTSVYNWCNAIKTPRMDKVDAMCAIFGCKRTDLMQEPDEVSYYTNEETAEMADKIFHNQELRLLFDAAQDAQPEDLATVHQMLLALKRKERGDID